MAVFKIEKNKDYTIMSNYHLRDRNLSYKAKGLLSFMLSLPEDWNYSINGLVAISKEGVKAIRNILQELKKYGYLIVDKKKNKFGKFEYEYLIYECPEYQKPPMELGDMEKGIQINTNIINTNKQIDKDDKEFKLSFFDDEHNYLTFRLIKNHYISEFDSKLHYYDMLFNELLENNNKSDLSIIIDYICKRVRDNNYKDEDGHDILNKYGYLKNSILSNINLLASRKESDELWSDEHIEELINLR